jgi:hypothetical protein
MTLGDVNGSGRAIATLNALVVVRVEDAVNPALAGHEGCSYESPPQQREQALTLVSLLLGCPGQPMNRGSRWTCPLAGGRRTVTVEPAPETGS